MRLAQLCQQYRRLFGQVQCVSARGAKRQQRNSPGFGFQLDSLRFFGRRDYKVAGLIFAKECSVLRAGRQGVDGCADITRQRHLGQTDGKAAVGQIVDCRDDARENQVANKIAIPSFGGQVHRRRRPIRAGQKVSQIGGLAQPADGFPNQKNNLAGRAKSCSGGKAYVLNDADAADGGRWRNAFALGFIVERDVAGYDREVQRTGRLANSLQTTDKLPHDLRFFGIAEIEVVGQRQRGGATRSNITPAFGDRLFPALPGIGGAVARSDVRGESEAFWSIADANHRSVAARLALRYCRG